MNIIAKFFDSLNIAEKRYITLLAKTLCMDQVEQNVERKVTTIVDSLRGLGTDDGVVQIVGELMTIELLETEAVRVSLIHSLLESFHNKELDGEVTDDSLEKIIKEANELERKGRIYINIGRGEMCLEGMPKEEREVAEKLLLSLIGETPTEKPKFSVIDGGVDDSQD